MQSIKAIWCEVLTKLIWLLLIVFCAIALHAQSGSPFVPLDSWVYPAIDRLTSEGIAEAPFYGSRPWTRRECAIVARNAHYALEADPHLGDVSARQLDRALLREFADDISSLQTSENHVALESVYARARVISGAPLQDSYHFGQTIANDFGRPYGEGSQGLIGASGYAVHGRFFLYARGEYQHAPSFAGYSPAVTAALRPDDRLTSSQSVVNASPRGTADVARLLDTYAGVRMGKWQATFGKQSLWWGTGNSGAMLFSNNVEPPYGLRLTNTDPIHLPSVFSWLGETRFDLFLSKLSGHQYPPRPFIHGEKISFKPTKDLELDFSRTVVFLGVGHGFTFHRFFNSYFSVGNNNTSNLSSLDPGDRKGGLTVSYHLPTTPVTLYFDSFSDDNPSPLAAFSRSPMNPGIYIARLPFVPRLDLRAEGFFTNVNTPGSAFGDFVYFNGPYKDSYTQKGFLLGNTVGREGTGAQVWTTYWFSPRTTLQLSYRDQKVAPDFIKGGGTQNTFYATANLLVAHQLEVSAEVVTERWLFPLLAAGPQHDYTGQIMVRIWGSDHKR